MAKPSTKDKLLRMGRDAFLRNGYKDTSLRETVKAAGFTLGAFYGYFPNKEALFDAIVEEAAESLFGRFARVFDDFSSLSEEEKIANLDASSAEGMEQMIAWIYQDFEVYKLLFCRAGGTRYADYLQRFIDQEIASTCDFIAILRAQGHALEIDNELVHILASALFSGFVEVIRHDMDKEKATQYVGQLWAFYTAGWHRLLGI